MTIAPAKLSDPAVRAFVAAVNSHDQDAFFALLTDDATMSDDGSDRNLAEWTDREIFSSHGHTVPIPGFRTVPQAEENAGALAKGPLTADQVAEVDRILGR